MTTRRCAASRRGAANSARPVSRCWRNTGAERARLLHLRRSVDRAVDALVIERAKHRTELVAERTLRARGPARVIGLVVFPRLDHREVVRPIGLLHHLEAHVAVALAV